MAIQIKRASGVQCCMLSLCYRKYRALWEPRRRAFDTKHFIQAVLYMVILQLHRGWFQDTLMDAKIPWMLKSHIKWYSVYLRREV